MGFDWEGVSATITLSTSFTYLLANISDQCNGTSVGGGSRWRVDMTTANVNTAAPAHRVSTFFTGPLISLYYLFNNAGARCDPNCDFEAGATFTLTRLTESRLSGCTAAAGLSLSGFASDGTFAQPPPPSARVLEFVGDSITAVSSRI